MTRIFRSPAFPPATPLLSAPTLALLNRFQHRFPLALRPYARLAEEAGEGWSEDGIIDALATAHQQGVLGRVGAIFAPNTVGASTLAAMAVPPERLDAVAHYVSSLPEVNHNYARAHHVNLWFVVTASDRSRVAEVLARIYLATGIKPLHLPLLKEYHIDLGFSFLPGDQPRPRECLQGMGSLSLSQSERRLVGALEDGLALEPEPYRLLAERADLSREEVLHILTDWCDSGVIRRFGLVVRHRELGYHANAMCVWRVEDEEERDDLGVKLAAEQAVTLCYARPARPPLWPYNLFCMIHAPDALTVRQTVDELRARHDVMHLPHSVLISTRRYTQRGARYGYRHD